MKTKKKIISGIFLVCFVLFSASLISSSLAATLDVVPVSIGKVGTGVAEWTTADKNTGSYSVHLKTSSTNDYAYMVIEKQNVDLPDTINDINSVSFYYKHVSWNEGPGPRIGIMVKNEGTDQHYLAVSGSADNNGSWVQAKQNGTHLTTTDPDKTKVWWYSTVNEDGSGYNVAGQSGPMAFNDVKTGLSGDTVKSVTIYMGVVTSPFVGSGEAYVDDVEVNGAIYYGMIQDAIDVANSGDTINVAAGTYVEQINIQKSLNVNGAGEDNTNIVSPIPSTMTIYDAYGSKAGSNQRYIGHRGANIPLVRIAASNVIFEGFHVNLNNQTFWDVSGSFGTPYSRSTGILVDHVETVSGTPDIFTGIIIRDNKVDGLLLGDKGDAIKIMGSASATVQRNTIYGYGKSSISAQGVDGPTRAVFYPNVIANDNTIYGGSETRPNVFFGIGFWSGASGSADGNTIYNAPINDGYALNSWTPRSVSFTNNLVKTDGGNVGGLGAQLYESPNLIFSNNKIEKQGLAAAIWSNPTATITNNTIKNCVDGFLIDGQTSGSVAINYNYISGTSPGHYAVAADGYDGSIYGSSDPSTITINAENNWWGSNSGPHNPTGNPTGTGGEVSDYVDFDPWTIFHLTLTSPEDGKSYASRKILLDFSTNLTADRIDYSTDTRFIRICSDCSSFSYERTYSEGNNTLTIKATLDNEVVNRTIHFFVDSVKPRIISTLPEDNSYLKGNVTFYVKYTEANLKNIILHWKVTTGTYNDVNLTGCPSGSYKECSTDIDLRSYDGSSINYYFEIQDSVNTTASSVKTITIDLTNPVVTINSPDPILYGEKSLLVNLGVSETVAKLEYSLDGHSYKSLCTDCSSYNKQMTFVDGDHTLAIKATDYAGNVGENSVGFSIDSKAPKITKISPANNKYTNGTFSITYSEENLKEISLFYIGPLDTTYTKVTKTDCESGKSKLCNFSATLTSYDGQKIKYYFEVVNHINKATSSTYTETVDTTLPTITVNSPTPTTYNTRKISFNIAVNEIVKLEYSDNGGKFKPLCSNCNHYDRLRTLSVGDHTLVFRATDKTGNVATNSVSFEIEL